MLGTDNRKVLCNNCFRLVSGNRGSRYNHNNCCPLRKIMEEIKNRYIETDEKIICTGCSMPFDNFYEYTSNHQPCQVHTQFMLQFNINNEKIRASLQQLGDDVDYKNFFTKVNDEATPKGKFEDVTENNIEYSSTTSLALSDTISSFDKEQSKKRKVQKFLGQSEYSEEEKNEDVDLIKQKSDFLQQNGELKKQLKESAERIETLMEQIVKLSDLDARSMGKVGVINNLRMNDILHLEKIISNDLILVQQKRAALEKEEKEWKSCAICKENEKTIVLYPCSHMCLCNFCASAVKLEQCPICNADILLKVSNKM